VVLFVKDGVGEQPLAVGVATVTVIEDGGTAVIVAVVEAVQVPFDPLIVYTVVLLIGLFGVKVPVWLLPPPGLQVYVPGLAPVAVMVTLLPIQTV
jgi:hypothetical protein